MAKKIMSVKPTVIQTKEELRLALKSGSIKSAKFNALNEDDKLFIELMVFGSYKPSQAMRAVKPHIKNPSAAAKRKMHNDDIVEALDELTYKRDKFWHTQVTSSRELALDTLEYMLKTSDDDAVKIAAAKEILGASDKATRQHERKQEESSGVTFNIKFSPDPKHPSTMMDEQYDEDEPVIVEDKEAEEETGVGFKLSYADNISSSYKKSDD